MYQHTQRSPLHWVLYLPAILLFFVAWQMRVAAPLDIIFGLVGLLLIILAFSFQKMTVRERDDYLEVRFGPLNIFGTRIRFSNITKVEIGKTRLMDGWGIHYVPFRGWTFNLWGFDCVKITQKTNVIRIGSNDADHLAEVVSRRVQS